MLSKYRVVIVSNIALISSVAGVGTAAEVQLTFEPHTHSLDNNDNFSPDDQWLVYDTRTEEGGIQEGTTIEKVHVRTGEIVKLYTAPGITSSGPGVAVASYHPTKTQVVFIHGLLDHTPDRPYAQWRRFGMLLDEARGGKASPVDARDVRAPFTVGALRGGTHRHEFSGDGKWIGFTYNDALMADKGEKYNLRTIGVMRLDDPVAINGPSDGSNFNGSARCALVVKVTPEPRPGSDEIKRAAWDSWIGTHGYRRADGKFQRARAFLGTVVTTDGEEVQDLFVVDIPEEITVPGADGPLEGTADVMPMRPIGVSQRRLTDTTKSRYPGFTGNVRSSPDGTMLACLAKDDDGIDQVVIASPLDGNPKPLTAFDTSVQSDVRWHPNGRHVCFVQGNAVIVADVKTRRARPVTEVTTEAPFALVWSRKGDSIAFNRAVAEQESGEKFAQIFVVDVKESDLP